MDLGFVTYRPVDADLDAWCVEVFGCAPVETIFEHQHLSRVVACRLADGREVVVKQRVPTERVVACLDVQNYLWSRGFPCPQPIAGPSFRGSLLLTAESYVKRGERLVGPDSAQRFAEALHRLLALTAGYQPRLSLEPAPPWLGWGHGGAGIWPPADDLPDDLNTFDTPWLDDVAQRAGSLLNATTLPRVVGHADWTNSNLEWRGGSLHVVHDWDSLAYLPEAAFAGGASVLFTQETNAAATLEESHAFLDAYEGLRSRPWAITERSVCWAAGLWNLAFDAKKDVVRGGGPSLERLRLEAGERLRLAGA